MIIIIMSKMKIPEEIGIPLKKEVNDWDSDCSVISLEEEFTSLDCSSEVV